MNTEIVTVSDHTVGHNVLLLEIIEVTLAICEMIQLLLIQLLLVPVVCQSYIMLPHLYLCHMAARSNT
jgi:hypothetical protein